MGKRELVALLERRLRPFRKRLRAAETRVDKPVKAFVEEALWGIREAAVSALGEGDSFHLTRMLRIVPVVKRGKTVLEARLSPEFEADALRRLAEFRSQFEEARP